MIGQKNDPIIDASMLIHGVATERLNMGPRFRGGHGRDLGIPRGPV